MSIAEAPPPRLKTTISRRQRRWIGRCAVATAVVGGVVWHGADRTPADATTPLVLRGDALAVASGRSSLRIGTFNIHGGRGDGQPVDLEATASVLRTANLDLAGLYEVRGDFTTDQAEELGELLDAQSLFVPTEHRWWHDDFGNGLVARCQVRRVIRIDLPGTQPKRFRNAFLTTVELGNKTVSILAAHLDTEVDRERQLKHVCEIFRSLRSPAVLMGDLNCTAEHPAIAELLREEGVVDAIAAKLGPESQRGRIDHLIVRGVKIVDAAIVPTEASDHPAVWAELTLEDRE
jgi:endonuclease/exonuclease/phosphatase family metal-dependent hydrolase